MTEYRGGNAQCRLARDNKTEDLLQLRVLGFGLLVDGDVGVGVFPEGAKSSGDLRYCGSPTLRTSSAKRGSECRGSSKKSVFKPSRPASPASRSCDKRC
jgi:hypothetical protein